MPPDYFSATGQLWGNPLYRWDVMERDGYRWWIERVRSLFDQVDIGRLRQVGAAEQVAQDEPMQQADAEALPVVGVFLGHFRHAGGG